MSLGRIGVSMRILALIQCAYVLPSLFLHSWTSARTIINNDHGFVYCPMFILYKYCAMNINQKYLHTYIPGKEIYWFQSFMLSITKIDDATRKFFSFMKQTYNTFLTWLHFLAHNIRLLRELFQIFWKMILLERPKSLDLFISRFKRQH